MNPLASLMSNPATNYVSQWKTGWDSVGSTHGGGIETDVFMILIVMVVIALGKYALKKL